MKRFAIAAILLLLLSTPLFAWYYFTASNGQRQQWVFGSSCNTSGSKPITMIYDSDIQGLAAGYQTAITTVMTQWNAPTGGTLLCPTATCSPSNGTYQRTMTASLVNSFLNNPTPNQIWMVWDTDGSVLRSVGIDPNSSVLGVGVGLDMNSSRPQDLCSGILLLNAQLILSLASPTVRFQQVTLHEIGHVLGFAHSIPGNNMGTVTASSSGCSGNACLPVMFPFLYTNSPVTLNPDDLAAARTFYAP